MARLAVLCFSPAVKRLAGTRYDPQHAFVMIAQGCRQFAKRTPAKDDQFCFSTYRLEVAVIAWPCGIIASAQITDIGRSISKDIANQPMTNAVARCKADQFADGRIIGRCVGA